MKRFRVLLEDRRELLPWEELVSSLSHPLSIKRSGLWVIKCSLKIYWDSKRLGWSARKLEGKGQGNPREGNEHS